MAEQKINLRPKGLYTNVNQLGTIPQGALSECENVQITRPNVLGVRRGKKTVQFFANLSNGEWQVGSDPWRLFNANLREGGTVDTNFQGTAVPGVISMNSDGSMWWSNDGKKFVRVEPTYNQSPILFTPPSQGGPRQFYGFEQAGAFFVSTSNGIIRVGRPVPSTFSGTPTTPEQILDLARSGYSPAGVPFGLNTSVADAGVGTAVNPDSQVAYRFCFGFRDASNIVHYGAPANRVTFTNPSNAQIRNTTVRTTIPPGINRKRHFWQLYRTQASSSQNTDPGDDCGLIKEGSFADPVNLVAAQRGAPNAATIATLTSAAPHGYVAGSVCDIPQDIILPAVQQNREVYIEQTSPNVRTVKTRLGDTTGYAAVGTFNLLTKEPGAPDYGKPILLTRDSVNSRIYYMEEGRRAIYVLNGDGTYNQTIEPGQGNYLPDLAVYDFAYNRIVMICRPINGPYASFNYVANQFHTVIMEMNNNFTIQSQNISPAFTNTGYTNLSAATIALRAGVGLYRKNRSTPLSVCIALPSVTVGMCVAISGNLGVSYSYQFGRQPFRWPGSAYNYSYISAVDTIENPTTFETTMLIGGTLSEGYPAPSGQKLNDVVTLYYVSSDPSSSPKLSISEFNFGGTNAADPVITKIQYIRVSRFDGTILAVYGNWNPVTASQLTLAASTFSTKYIPSGTWSAVQNIPATATGEYYKSNVSIVDASIASPASFVVTVASVGVSASYRLTSAALPTWPIVSLEVEAVTSGTFPIASSKSPSLAASPVIDAGAYTVLAAPAPTATTFAITSVQTPVQIDFATTAINVTTSQTELAIIDDVKPEFIGPYLYSSPSVEGALQFNYSPPFCQDAALFRTTAFYANCKQRTSLQISTLALPVAGDRVYLGSNTTSFLTAGAAENISNKTFLISANADASIAIRETIQSLCRVANANWPEWRNVILPIGVGINSFSTFFVIGVLPSDFVKFKFTNSTGVVKAGIFTPNEVFGESQSEKNVIYYSKPNQPDAVPIFNSLRIGSDTKGILRIMASRDSLFVFKEDGTFIIRGYGAPWQVDPYDLSLRLAIPDSLALLDNIVYGAFTRGIYKVSDATAEIVSLPVQNLIEEHIVGDLLPGAQNYAFAVTDNSDHKYLLWLNVNNEDELPEVALVWDSLTSEWSTWRAPARHCISYKDSRLLYATEEQAASNRSGQVSNGIYPCIKLENKDITKDDFFDDYQWTTPNTSDPVANLILVSAYDQATKFLQFDAVNAPDLKEGDVITYQPSGQVLSDPDVAIVASSDPALNGVYLQETPSWLQFTGPFNTYLQAYRSIPFGWKFAQMFPNSPAATNHFSEFAVSFREVFWSTLKCLFVSPDTEVGLGPTEVPFDGLKHFDSRRAWKDNYIRTYVPRANQRGTALVAGISTQACGFSIECNGMTLILTQGPTSFQRR